MPLRRARRIVTLMPAVLAVSLAGAPPASWGGAAPSPTREVEVRRDVAYGPHARHRLDAYLQPETGPHPVIVFVHGGGHVAGDKQGGGLNLILPAARAGYSIVSINYRLAPEFKHPAQVEDARLGVRWVRAHAGELRVDPARVAVAGASAGGHIVTFLAFTLCPGDAVARDAVARQSCRPSTAVNFFGTIDLRARPNDALLVALLGSNPSPALKAEASPITHVSPDDPPILSLHGTADSLVPYAQSVALHETLTAARVANRLITVESGGHGNNWFSFPGAEAWQRALVEWLDRHVKS